MVRITQLPFAEGTLPEDLTWATIVLLLKGKGEHRGIWVVGVTCKVCVGVVSIQLKRGVELNDVIHGFRVMRGIGTGNLEANLSHQLSGISQEPLF